MVVLLSRCMHGIVVTLLFSHTILFGLSIRHKQFRLLSLISLSSNSENISKPAVSQDVDQYEDSSITLVNKGLKNLGNTCYMNSILQGLYTCSEFRLNVLSTRFRNESTGWYLKSIFSELSQSPENTRSDYLHHIGQLCHLMARTLEINVRVQEDAEEFYLRLLNAVDNSMMQLDEDDSEPVSPPSSRFLVRMEQSIRYLYPNETRRKEQRFLDLSIDLPQSGEEFIRLEEAVGRVFESEQLSAGERAALKTLTLRSRNAPPLLAVHVKRFAFDTASGSMTKVMSAVRIPRELRLPLMEEGPNPEERQSVARYTLSSVVVHEGWRLDFGHYYLLAREQSRCGDSSEEQWIQLNDHVVQKGVTAEQADLLASKGAYMIFYTRADTNNKNNSVFDNR